VRSKPGKFELANKGHDFLDEIRGDENSFAAKLLTFLADTNIAAGWAALYRERSARRSLQPQRGCNQEAMKTVDS